MKKYSLYLHQEIIDLLECFGELSDVINRLLEECIDKGLIYQDVISNAPDRDGARRIDVFIKYDNICQLANLRVRSIVYWFVENEIYTELGWQMRNDYGKKQKQKIEKQFNLTISNLRKLDELCNGKVKDVIDIIEKIRYNL